MRAIASAREVRSRLTPQTLEDCYERYGEDTNEFLACVFAVEQLQAMQEGD